MGSKAIPDISVIIPLYNKGKYIARALDSVFAQTYQDFELIVVDDGSTDEGPDIVRTYHDARLRLIQQANSGPGAARNRGLKESNAPYVAFLDADDEWLGEFLERSVERIHKHPDCALTISGYFQGPKRINMEPVLREYGITEGEWRLPRDISPEDFKHSIDFFNSWAILCSRKVVEKYGGHYAKQRINYGEDTYLWLQVALNHKVYRHLEPLVWYHSEASELGIFGRKTVRPPRPILTDPSQIRKNCPPKYRNVLESSLTYYALHAVKRLALAGDKEMCHNLLHGFPQMSSFGLLNYIKTHILVFCIPLIKFVKSSPRLRNIIRKIRVMTSAIC